MGDSTEKPVKVLICEDNMVSRMIAEAACTKLGCDVVSQESVEAAIQEIGPPREEAPFDLVLTDMHLLGENGLDLIRRIRELGWSGFRLPVAIMTANPGAAEEMACHNAGGQFVLAKPISDTVLADIIDRARPIQMRNGGERILQDMLLVRRYQQALLTTRDALSPPAELFTQPGGARTQLIALLHELAGVGSLFGNPALAIKANALENDLRAGLPDGLDAFDIARNEVLALLQISILPGFIDTPSEAGDI